jgi:hypothetical protein
LPIADCLDLLGLTVNQMLDYQEQIENQKSKIKNLKLRSCDAP